MCLSRPHPSLARYGAPYLLAEPPASRPHCQTRAQTQGSSRRPPLTSLGSPGCSHLVAPDRAPSGAAPLLPGPWKPGLTTPLPITRLEPPRIQSTPCAFRDVNPLFSLFYLKILSTYF